MVFNCIDDVMGYAQTHTNIEILYNIMVKLLPRESHGATINDECVMKMREQLNEKSQGRYTDSLGDVIWEEVTDIIEHKVEYSTLYNDILADETSRDVLFNLMAFRLTRDAKYLAAAFCPDSQQYFDKQIIQYKDNCVYADCGALDGETTAEFILHCPDYRKIYLYEPVDEYYSDCLKNIGQLQEANVVFRKAAVCEEEKVLRFVNNTGGRSKTDEQGDLTVEGVSLDRDITEPLGFIKMDIEGSEKEAILGAKNHIRRDSPVLAICVYHLAVDVWKIPFMIREINPQYRFLLRHHTMMPNETVLYALPLDLPLDIPHGTLSDKVKAVCLEALYTIRANANAVNEGLRKSEMLYLLQQLSNYHEALDVADRTLLQMEAQTQPQNMARLYYEEQMKGYEELKKWVEELESSKTYYEEQMKGYEELKKWAEELEKSKTYYEKQMDGYEELKKWAEELEKSKTYYEKQMDGYEELKKWAEELEKSKTYYEEQMDGYEELKKWAEELEKSKSDYEEQMRGYKDLQDWTAKLIEAKEYLEQQVANRDAIIQELNARQ